MPDHPQPPNDENESPSQEASVGEWEPPQEPNVGSGDGDRVASGGRDPYAVWRGRDFRHYTASWFLMTFAKQVETVAVGIYLYHQTGQALALGWLGLVQALPFMLLAVPAGQLGDRVDRKRVMMATLTLSCLVSVGLIAITRQGLAVEWYYLPLAIGAISQATGSPSRSALLPQLVPAEAFSGAVAWNSTVFQIAAMTGPAVGGWVVGAGMDVTTAFGLVLVCRVVSLAAIASVKTRPVERQNTSISLESLVAGVRFVRQTKLILATITLDLFAVLLGGATYLLPIFAMDILGVDAFGLGLLRSAEAVGAVCMALAIAHLPPMRRAGRTLLWAVAGFGAATIVFGVSQSFWLSMGMMFLIGAFDNVSVVVRHTLVQMLTPDEMRSRVSAVNNVFIVSSNDLGGLESGLTAWLVGPIVSVVGGGIGTILVVIGAARLWPEILSIGSLHDVRPLDPREAEREAEEELAARG